MLFEVYNQNNKQVMVTEDPLCIDDNETLADMSKYAGYKFKLNGKSISLTKIKELRNNGNI